MLPAGIGAPGTYLGLGTYDHRVLKGGDMIVLRRIVPGGGWERLDGIPHASRRGMIRALGEVPGRQHADAGVERR